MQPQLLVIEDDPEFADYLLRGLTFAGYQVQTAVTGEIGIQNLNAYLPDLVILDVMLPGIDGMTACQLLRKANYEIPVLMLTARNAVGDRVAGLSAGADDYLGKPFDFDELLARLRALLRRHTPHEQVAVFSDLELDTNLYQAQRHGKSIPLSKTEFQLLALFFAQPQKVLDRETITQTIWQERYDGSTKVLDVYISRLRRKLGLPSLIHTVHGVGYILKEER